MPTCPHTCFCGWLRWSFRKFIEEAVAHREERRAACQKADIIAPDTMSQAAFWKPAYGTYDNIEALAAEGRAHGVKVADAKYGADVNGLRELIV